MAEKKKKTEETPVDEVAAEQAAPAAEPPVRDSGPGEGAPGGTGGFPQP
jgi:hypothetical protein